MTSKERQELSEVVEILSQMQDELTALRKILQTNAAVVANGSFDKRTFEHDGTYEVRVLSDDPIIGTVTVYRNKVSQTNCPVLQWAVAKSKPWTQVRDWLQKKGEYHEVKIS